MLGQFNKCQCKSDVFTDNQKQHSAVHATVTQMCTSNVISEWLPKLNVKIAQRNMQLM